MKKSRLLFNQPFAIRIENSPMPEPADRELLVATRLSAISAGTEMLVFRGQFPADLPVDEGIPSLAGHFQYPLAYGYSCVGEVVAAGASADPGWIGRRVFAFHPHESHFCAKPNDLFPLPDHLADEDAVFLASMETAVNLLMDGRPAIGERVIVWGQGVIGLLTTALLAQVPLERLVTVDRLALRRRTSDRMGADLVLSGDEEDFTDRLFAESDTAGIDRKADLIFELSGNPDSLNTALICAGFDTRVVIGSWYGTKPVNVDLGGRFHRDRIKIEASQVSTIAPPLAGRWTPERRLQMACRMLDSCRPGHLITKRFDIRQAQNAYELLANCPQDHLQLVFTYPRTR